MLIVFRVLQGIGGGGLAPTEQAILADTFPPSKRPQAFALYGIAVIVAPTVGPTSAAGSPTTIPGTGCSSSMCRSACCRCRWCIGWWSSRKYSSANEHERLAGGLSIDWVGFSLVA